MKPSIFRADVIRGQYSDLNHRAKCQVQIGSDINNIDLCWGEGCALVTESKGGALLDIVLMRS